MFPDLFVNFVLLLPLLINYADNKWRLDTRLMESIVSEVKLSEESILGELNPREGNTKSLPDLVLEVPFATEVASNHSLNHYYTVTLEEPIIC